MEGVGGVEGVEGVGAAELVRLRADGLLAVHPARVKRTIGTNTKEDLNCVIGYPVAEAGTGQI